MAYDPPGRADELAPELLARWNDRIKATFDRQREDLKRRFFELDFTRLREPLRTDTVKWPADPAEPRFCVDELVAEELCDWGVRGRHALHNEYCEYAVIAATDGAGRRRPKRVEVTTELREYWCVLAREDPELVRELAASALGGEVALADLFGVADPTALDPDEREVAFARAVAGNGGELRLADAGVPRQPTGRLNTERALFMTHPINGLDDLLFIVLFGSVPYALVVDGERRRASTDEIFASAGSQELACRHADPAAALGAYDVALGGGQVAFANPLGMYIREPNLQVFLFEDEPIPGHWVRFGRGAPGMRQRLVFGPDDEDGAFLDDIVIASGAAERPLRGGYQLLRELEVGPLLFAGKGAPVADGEWKVIEAAPPIACESAAVCEKIQALKAEFDAQAPGATGLSPTG